MQQVAARMRTFPVTRERFNWRLSKSLADRAIPAWEVLEPDKIDLDYHFRHSALPQPGSELELALVVSRLATHPIDLSRPPWEVHLIEGLHAFCLVCQDSPLPRRWCHRTEDIAELVVRGSDRNRRRPVVGQCAVPQIQSVTKKAIHSGR